MLRYIYADDLSRFPRLADGMFRDRANQFKERLGWDVTVDGKGHELDDYDALNPLYAIWDDGEEGHFGSMRFLPTTGPTMVNDHFSHILGGGSIVSPLIWECTRFCLSRNATSRIAPALMLAGVEIMRQFGVQHLVGAFDARMVRIYRRFGALPEIIGSHGEGREEISIGLWECTETLQHSLSEASGISAEVSAVWLNESFGGKNAFSQSLSDAFAGEGLSAPVGSPHDIEHLHLF